VLALPSLVFANHISFCSAAVQPFFGQTANIFGRRWLTIGAVVIFAFGSGLSGGATSGAMLIAGRTFQGIGGGGVNLMADVILCDLLPMRERGAYMGLMLMVFFFGTSVGPYVGGVLAKHNCEFSLGLKSNPMRSLADMKCFKGDGFST